MKFNGKVVVVTGAGSGMGREITRQLIAKGAKVAMVDINTKGMSETAELCGNKNISIHEINITDRTQVEQLPEKIIKEHGVVDAIVNNAGIIQPFVDVEQLDYNTIERVMNINFYGCVYMTKAFLPHLLKRPEAHIANTSSMGGFIPFPGQTIYGASKAAIKLFTEGLYAELKDTNVHVTVIHPGAVNTNIMSNSGVASKEEEAASKKQQDAMAMPADKAASVILDGIERNKFRVLVGKDARFLDKFYRLNPEKAVRFIVKKMSGLVK